jgi:magnesium-transporting ATPase (P-type)
MGRNRYLLPKCQLIAVDRGRAGAGLDCTAKSLEHRFEMADIIRSMKTNDRRPKAVTYLFLLTIQIVGAIFFVWQELPEFSQVLRSPGEQLPKDTSADLMMVGVFCAMQIAFWCRLRYVPIPFRRPNAFLNHAFLFLGRLSFIFGSALFSVVVFRHLPELSRETDILLAVQRGIILVGCLFALFCTSLEVERLGQAFDGSRS